ncbi:MAG: Gfo/Idh/MocA family oxidoreductase [Candidatus Brockarchaeota archaeon]|nr:Gfo/Idh/MocA family oxidoreductase [Candidatus Brockarchaeota archaeon]
MVRYRVGIVGCGRMAGSIDDEVLGYAACILPYSHAAAYSALGIKIVAAADIDAGKLEAFCKRWKVESRYSDYRKMIDDEGLDILSVTTPATVRHEIVMYAVKSGVKAIYCEKAMCCSMSQADEIAEACERSKAKLNVGTLRRFHPGYWKMRETIEGGRLGEPKVVVAYASGALMHTHSHTVDTVRFLLGDPKPSCIQGEIEGSGYDGARNAFDRDPSLVWGHVSFEGGKHAFIVPSPGLYEFEVDCTKGVARVLDNGIDWRMRVMVESDKWGSHEPAPFPPFEKSSPTVECIKDLINAIETGSDTKCNAKVGRDGMELCVGMALSHLRDGAKVKPPLENRNLYIPSL